MALGEDQGPCLRERVGALADQAQCKDSAVIVDPDFLDHWRTRMLVDALGGDEMAPMYVMRIWGHCQQRRGDSFAMPAAGLKAMCRAMCDAQALETALIEAGFIERDGPTIRVPKWAEKNAALIAAWDNGGRGGRKATKEPKPNPRVTQTEPTGNPRATHGEPMANPSLTQAEPIREEKSREEEEKKYTPISPQGGKRPKAAPIDCPQDVDPHVWADWLALRKAKRAPVTATVLEAAEVEAGRAGMGLEAFLRVWCARGSQGLQADWLRPQERPQQTPAESTWQREARENVERMTGGLVSARRPQQQKETIDGCVIESRHTALG